MQLLVASVAGNSCAFGCWCRGLLRESLKDYSVLVNGATIPLPMNEALWTFTDESRRLLAAASLPPSCKFYKCAHAPALPDVEYAN